MSVPEGARPGRSGGAGPAAAEGGGRAGRRRRGPPGAWPTSGTNSSGAAASRG